MDITVQELKDRLDKGDDFIFIDVREVYEYEEFNLGAQNIPLTTLPGRLADFSQEKDSEIVVHCRSGGRSAMAQQMMTMNGFTNVRNLIGGVNAWIDAFE